VSTFKALGHDGTVSSRLRSDGTLEHTYRVRVGRELFEYCDTVAKSELHSAGGRVGELRRRAVIRRIEREMIKRGIKPKLLPNRSPRY
jgi:hypothetical protein